ncbi:HAMP domain-containing histidine kinase [Hymenobacter sp. BT683]|uniref:histidine kinase n=1 Tax=Hymenobacter jeongseonensis TaxID=2791027 RepID=A0ABS0IMD0_9BACT|nr:HAMP domain-containing sensor histidine kinase [Hymenobacter jeongseonensis]MBF9239048.1 HAMP domain-containing histidine kinase [Hymenobacter jeongseonensis]
MLNQTEILHHVVQGSPILLFAYSVSAREVLFVNEAYERIFPQSRRDTATADLPALLRCLPPEDQQYALGCLTDLANGELQDDLLLRMQLEPNVPLRWLCVRAHRAVASDGQVLLCGSVQDVTVDHEYTRNADKFMAKKNTTLEILSHDLAGPFNMLQQMAGFFQEKTQDLHDPQLEKMVQVMQDTCRDSINLIREFVDSEFAESASVQLKRARVDLAASIRQVMDTYQQSEHLVNKRFSFSSTPDKVYIELDNNKFLQVMNNLLSNAIKFTGEGGHIAVTVVQHPQHVLVTVADDGIGIPEKLQPVLYDRFTKARRPGLRGEKTTGLGMSIIQALVRLHGGGIWCESQENAGTTFFIQLPTEAPRPISS